MVCCISRSVCSGKRLIMGRVRSTCLSSLRSSNVGQRQFCSLQAFNIVGYPLPILSPKPTIRNIFCILGLRAFELPPRLMSSIGSFSEPGLENNIPLSFFATFSTPVMSRSAWMIILVSPSRTALCTGVSSTRSIPSSLNGRFRSAVSLGITRVKKLNKLFSQVPSYVNRSLHLLSPTRLVWSM